jgi:hypothetical protein
LAVDDPLLGPDVWVDLLQEPGGFHRVTVLGPDNAGQRSGVHKVMA